MNKPMLNGVVISPNPAFVRETVTITLDIEDREIVFQKSVYYSGEIKAGEKMGDL